jgi:hypothetical protein
MQGDFFYVDVMCVAALIERIISNATVLDGIPLVFIKFLLPLILPVPTQLFISNLTSFIFPFVWKISNVVPIPKDHSLTLFPSFLSSHNVKADLVILEQMADYVIRNNLILVSAQ